MSKFRSPFGLKKIKGDVSVPVPAEASSKSVPGEPSLASLTLSCLVEGNNSVFHVDIAMKSPTSTLKELIVEKRKHNLLKGTDPADLVILKVSAS
jgi:hypothetical protein